VARKTNRAALVAKKQCQKDIDEARAKRKLDRALKDANIQQF
jgi:hypothetical protein